MPDAAIGADVMTGFPGETEAEFDQTLRFIEQQPFTYLHVFTYSERPGNSGGGCRRPDSDGRAPGTHPRFTGIVGSQKSRHSAAG